MNEKELKQYYEGIIEQQRQIAVEEGYKRMQLSMTRCLKALADAMNCNSQHLNLKIVPDFIELD